MKPMLFFAGVHVGLIHANADHEAMKALHDLEPEREAVAAIEQA